MSVLQTTRAILHFAETTNDQVVFRPASNSQATDDVSVLSGLFVLSGLYAFDELGQNWDRVRISNNNEVIAQTGNRAFANTSATVTNASQEFLASNVNRRYLLIQNNDAAGVIFVRFGAAATLTTGVKIGPGAVYELDSVAPNNSINIIGDIASNANVVIVEG